MTTINQMPAPVLADQLAAAEAQIEILSESLVDAQLALEDRGWNRVGDTGQQFTKTYMDQAAQVCRASTVLNPLTGRGVNLRIAYIWGAGLTVAAADGAETDNRGQDVNAVVQAFLDDDLNKAAFTSGQAQEENERALATDGNVLLALVTDQLTGRVQVRSVPFSQVTDKILNPDDADDVWFFRRTSTVTSFTASATGVATASSTQTVYHPAVTYRPRLRPKMLNDEPILWDQPMVHVAVNRLDGWKWGIGDVYPAVAWARGYSEFLQDWARLMKALAKLAYTTTAKTGAGAARVRDRLGAAEAGSAVTVGQDQTITAVSKSGATLDSDSGRPLAAMVASALDLPVTLLLADPGVTGARAVAETLDEPTYLLMGMRRNLWGDAIVAVLNHVIDSAIRAPQGPLRGTVTLDPTTGRDRLELLGGQERRVTVDWPDLSKTDPDTLVSAITAADATGKMPPVLVAQLLMQALGVDDIDEWLAKLLDADGEFIDQADAVAARSALAAVTRGDVPAA